MTAPNHLPDPFRPAQPEARVQRMWRAIDARRSATDPSRSAVRGPLGLRLGLVAALAGVAAVAGMVGALGVHRAAPAPLTLASGATLPASWEGPARVALSDGSVLQLAAGSRVELIESADHALGLALRRGRVRFSVEPHGPRRWSIDCGVVHVAVVGTIFTIARTDASVGVRVARGAVVVRGDGVPDRVQRLGAGQHAEVRVRPAPVVDATSPASAADHGPPQAAPLAAREHANEVAAAREPRTVRADSAASALPASGDAAEEALYRDAVARGDFGSAFERLGEDGVRRRALEATHVEALFELADVARLSGHPELALVPLTRIVDRFPTDARAAMAAYTMGQLEAGSLHHPRLAADHFARSLALGLPRSVRESASYRLVEALAAARSPEVTAAAAAYLEAYPSGRYRAEVERWRAR